MIRRSISDIEYYEIVVAAFKFIEAFQKRVA